MFDYRALRQDSLNTYFIYHCSHRPHDFWMGTEEEIKLLRDEYGLMAGGETYLLFWSLAWNLMERFANGICIQSETMHQIGFKQLRTSVSTDFGLGARNFSVTLEQPAKRAVGKNVKSVKEYAASHGAHFGDSAVVSTLISCDSANTSDLFMKLQGEGFSNLTSLFGAVDFMAHTYVGLDLDGHANTLIIQSKTDLSSRIGHLAGRYSIREHEILSQIYKDLSFQQYRELIEKLIEEVQVH